MTIETQKQNHVKKTENVAVNEAEISCICVYIYIHMTVRWSREAEIDVRDTRPIDTWLDKYVDKYIFYVL